MGKLNYLSLFCILVVENVFEVTIIIVLKCFEDPGGNLGEVKPINPLLLLPRFRRWGVE